MLNRRNNVRLVLFLGSTIKVLYSRFRSLVAEHPTGLRTFGSPSCLGGWRTTNRSASRPPDAAVSRSRNKIRWGGANHLSYEYGNTAIFEMGVPVVCYLRWLRLWHAPAIALLIK
jgi:hypothetical protein